MSRTHLWTWAVVVCLFSAPMVCAQSQPASDVSSGPASVAAVPRLIKFSGAVRDARGEPLGNVAVRLTFAVYEEPQGGAALWIESQGAQLDEQGHYNVLLGATRADGLPVELFPAGKARWLGVQVEGRDEDPRVLLVSVPYALKAEDAAMLGGRSAADFVLGEQLKEEVRTQVAAQTPGIATQAVEMLVSNPPKAPAIAEGPSTFTCATAGDCVAVTQSGTGRALRTTAMSANEAVLVQQTGTGYGLRALAPGNVALYGQITGSAGTSYGVKGQTTSSTGAGVFGYNLATTGLAYGILGQTSSTSGTALFGRATATTGATIGLRGHVDSTSGTGIMGQATATSGTTTGLVARVFSVDGTALVVDNTKGGRLLSGKVGSLEKFSVDGSGNALTAGTLTGTQLVSTAASGTAPLSVTSNTLVPNLNADLLDGLHAVDFQPAGAYATLGINIFTNTQTIGSGNLSVTSGNVDLPQTTSASAGVINLGGSPFIHACCSASQQNTFVGSNAGNFTTTGNYNSASGYHALSSNTTGTANTASGYAALVYNTTGNQNTASGKSALAFNTTGNQNTGSGWSALVSNTTGFGNTASGAGALLSNTTGHDNTASGQGALYSNTTGYFNTASGSEALSYNCYNVPSGCTAQNNTAVGYYAGVTTDDGNANVTGANNTFIGSLSGPGTSTQLSNATALGYNALVSASNALVLGGTGGDAVNVGIGTTTPAHTLDVVGNVNASGNVSGSQLVSTVPMGTAPLAVTSNTLVPGLNADRLDGFHAGAFATLGINIFTAAQTIGSGNLSVTSGNISLPDTTSASAGVINLGGSPFIHAYGGNTFVGINAGNFTTTGLGGTASGGGALFSNTTGNFNTANGSQALYANTTGNFNTASGMSALFSNTTGGMNTASGWNALFSSTTGGMNTASGSNALYSNTTGTANTASGSGALSANTTGYRNSAGGADALSSNTTGRHNTASGAYALRYNCENVADACTGNYNTAVGSQAGVTGNSANANRTGGNNTFLGALSGPGTSTELSNATAIGYNALVSASNALVLGGTGDFAVNVGIGTTTPAQKLDVVGNVNASGNVSGSQLVSAVATGTPPLAVTSNTLVPSLNADRLDGFHAGAFATLGTNIFTNTQTIGSGNLSLASGNISLPETTSGSVGVINLGGASFIHACCSTSAQNTFVGQQAGNSTMTGGNNIGIGFQALVSNTTGSNNTATGLRALYSNTTGTWNTATGMSALYQNTTGGFNTASGWNALYSNTTGRDNTASGSQALSANTTGRGNTASGFVALNSNTTGQANTASGAWALTSNTEGSNNTASAYQALFSNTTGGFNTASGYQALYLNTVGYMNTASGMGALRNNTTGNNNSASGTRALQYNCENVAGECTGNHNTAVGYQAGVTGNSANANRTGANNTFLGALSGPGTSTQLSNATAIGYNALVSASNALVLGGPNGSGYEVNVGIGTTAPAHTLDVVGDINSSGSVTATSFVGPLSGIAADLECTGCVAPPELSFDPATQAELDTESTARAAADTTLEAAVNGRVLKSGDTMVGTLTLPANGLVAGTDQLVLAGGRVGVGTASPAEKLEVNGTVKATGFSGDGSGLTNIQGSQIVNTVNTLQVALLKWYPANQAGTAFAVGTQPYAVAFDGASIWVSNWGSNNVTKLRASDGTVLGTFDVGTRPQGMAFDGANMWVGNTNSNNVTKLRASDGADLGTFAVGTYPSALAFDGANIWVTNLLDNNVTKLRASDGANLGTFDVGIRPQGVAFDGANIWVGNTNSNNVTKLRASDGTVLGTFDVGANPAGVAFDGANIWVANYGSINVTKLRASDGANLGTFAVGNSPAGVAFDGANIWVTNASSNNVSKLLASDGANLGTFAVGSQPWGAAFDGANIWVTNASSGTASKL